MKKMINNKIVKLQENDVEGLPVTTWIPKISEESNTPTTFSLPSNLLPSMDIDKLNVDSLDSKKMDLFGGDE